MGGATANRGWSKFISHYFTHISCARVSGRKKVCVGPAHASLFGVTTSAPSASLPKPFAPSFDWIIDRVRQHQFDIQFCSGALNRSDFFYETPLRPRPHGRHALCPGSCPRPRHHRPRRPSLWSPTSALPSLRPPFPVSFPTPVLLTCFFGAVLFPPCGLPLHPTYSRRWNLASLMVPATSVRGPLARSTNWRGTTSCGVATTTSCGR